MHDAQGIYACLVRWGFVADSLQAVQYMVCVETGKELEYMNELIRMNLYVHTRVKHVQC